MGELVGLWDKGAFAEGHPAVIGLCPFPQLKDAFLVQYAEPQTKRIVQRKFAVLLSRGKEKRLDDSLLVDGSEDPRERFRVRNISSALHDSKRDENIRNE